MANIVRFDLLRSVVFSSITSSYTLLAPPFGHAMRSIDFTNYTDAIIYVSFDRINDNIVVLPGSFKIFDLTLNQDENESLRFQIGTNIYIKYVGAAPTARSFYLDCMYGKGE